MHFKSKNRSSSVVSVRSKDSSELLETELPSQAFSSNNEDDDTENYDNDTASSKSIEDAAQVAYQVLSWHYILFNLLQFLNMLGIIHLLLTSFRNNIFLSLYLCCLPY